MLDEAISLVKTFQEKAKQTVRESTTLLSQNEIQRRIKWISEELRELQEAETVEEQADAITDALYYLLGCYVEMGFLRPDNLFRTIHESNMSKLSSAEIIYDTDGRVLKPKEWKHPQVNLDK